MTYKASLDLTSKIITAGVFGLFFFVAYKSGQQLLAANGAITVILLHSAVILFLPAVIVGCYLYSPYAYIITDNELIIKRRINSRHIPLEDIEDARLITNDLLSGTIRTFGVGGLFGYYGEFYNRKIGRMKWYTTRRDNRVLIWTRDKKKIVVTPDDVGFVTELRDRMGRGS